jgi:hypothetical protein
MVQTVIYSRAYSKPQQRRAFEFNAVLFALITSRPACTELASADSLDRIGYTNHRAGWQKRR